MHLKCWAEKSNQGCGQEEVTLIDRGDDGDTNGRGDIVSEEGLKERVERGFDCPKRRWAIG